MPKKRIVIVGATGSIGSSTLKIIRAHPERFELVGIAAHKQGDALCAIAQEFKVPYMAVCCPEVAKSLQGSPKIPNGTTLLCGNQGLEELVCLEDIDLVVMAPVGIHGLAPTLAALRIGRTVALANKETLVLGGALVKETCQHFGGKILPLDSEHNALFQCLEGVRLEHVQKLYLTASGGAFRDLALNELAHVTAQKALEHPNWLMGPKVTIDCATLANKGLELIEAHWLFDLPGEKLGALLHRQSIVHGLIECIDGCILSEISPPDMVYAIQHAMLYPDRAPAPAKRLDLSRTFSLDFAPVDYTRYPAFAMAEQALRAGGAYPGIFNAANEEAVEAFIAEEIGFLDIPTIIDAALQGLENQPIQTLGDALAVHNEARRWTREKIATLLPA
ncbi:MAG: 1-deoxy-D-xylulose-5-phosphate reductoisomerase [Verrucomicrobia bacterium 21-51-4]|nr:MAG: 1-deoxy-D-xylulose-5-phosphate reductoisomerase [Verrucomicrobia bacterium 21-51-4]